MITVIIPFYNSEETIIRTINSLKNQTVSDFKVLLINDGSTDTSEKLALNETIGDKRFTVINKKNEGVSATRNLGISLVNTKFLSFLDSDDSYKPNFIKKFYDEFRINQNFDLIAFKNPKNRITSSELNSINYLKHKNTPDTNCWIINKNVLTKNDIKFDTDLFWGEDMLFFYKVLKCSENIVYINSIQTETINTDGSLSKIIRRDYSYKFEWLKRLTNFSSNIEEKKIINSYLKKGTYLGLLVSGNINKKDARKYVKKIDVTNGIRSIKLNAVYVFYFVKNYKKLEGRK